MSEHAPDATQPRPLIAVSIVSHGHDQWLTQLLSDLARTAGDLIAQVIVTHNLPSKLSLSAQNLPFELSERTNSAPLGFATNHNRAFASVRSPLFCILNPDISLPDSGIWAALAGQASSVNTGCAFPILLNPDGSIQDNRRAAPTPWALYRRRMLARAEQHFDWVSAAFWLVPSAVYADMGGMDERYRLYCEDVDFCLRLQLAGRRLVPAPVHAIHHAQRTSHRSWRHLCWHLASLLRLWCSPALWRYLWCKRLVTRS